MKLQSRRGLHSKLGAFLKDQRVISGLTQSDVANKLGYSSPQFISNFERGLCSPPLKQLRQLVKLYKLDGRKLVNLILEEQESALRGALLGKGRAN